MCVRWLPFKIDEKVKQTAFVKRRFKLKIFTTNLKNV